MREECAIYWVMSFFQDPPRPGHAYEDDTVLREYLERALPPEVRREAEPELRELGEQAVTILLDRQIEDRRNEPELIQWSPWGRRIDEIRVTAVWREGQKLAARYGLVAAGYDTRFGAWRRVHQHALNYLVDASLDVYSCPLAMTDGAARTLLDLGNEALIARAVPRLTSRDPDAMWTSGQWMTERTGGSDVGLTETVARRDGDAWRLHGTKWFTSATTADMALTLARPEGNGPGGKGLALFYLETRDEAGAWNGIAVNRLKDKLGTRKVPTAELTLDGARAIAVAGTSDGVKNITPMLTVTRLWNAVGSIAGMARGLALARDYARRRFQFGALLAEKPLHVDTLAGLEAERNGALLLTFRMAELLGRREAGELTDDEERLMRVLTPLAKLTTAKQAVAVASEVLESFGGAGYVEDTGLPRILRDAQVLPIWEGTTNVLSLDALRALSREGTLEALEAEAMRRLDRARPAELAAPVAAARAALAHARAWLEGALAKPARVEAGARRFALTLGRSLELALLTDHAAWCLAEGRGGRAAAAARRLARNGVDLITDGGEDDARQLV
jgi:alkylation response protein AidB-like acyl-CoA dehydrogenase